MPFVLKTNQSNKIAAAREGFSLKQTNSKLLQNDVRRATSFTLEEVGRLKQVFEFFDISNTKTMHFKDLLKSFQSLGIYVEREEIKCLFSLLNVDEDKTLDFSEFCMVIDFIKEGHGKWRELRDAFRVFDPQNVGNIAIKDFEKLMMTFYGDQSTTKDVHAFIKFANKNKSGVINYTELVDLMREHENNRNAQVPLKPQTSKSSELDWGSFDKKNEKKTSKLNSNIVKSNNSNYVELVNNVEKAVAGPILLNSAIIIQFDPSASLKKS